MVRLLILLGALAILIAGVAFVTLACAPFQDPAPAGPSVEIDIDVPKKHKKPPTYRKSR